MLKNESSIAKQSRGANEVGKKERVEVVKRRARVTRKVPVAF